MCSSDLDGDTVTNMTVNQAALDKWNAEHPEPTPVEPEPSTDDVLNALIGYGDQSAVTREEEGK